MQIKVKLNPEIINEMRSLRREFYFDNLDDLMVHALALLRREQEQKYNDKTELRFE